MLALSLLSCGPAVRADLPERDSATVAALALLSVEPGEGPAEGGTTLRVLGEGFSGEGSATVGDAPCATLSWLSDTEGVCVSPAGAPGVVELVVSQGYTSVSLPFTYVGAADTGRPDTGRPDTGDSGETGAETGEVGDSSADTADTAVELVPIGYCHLQYPCSMDLAAGSPSDAVYGWIYQAGVTEGEGEGARILAEVGFGAAGSEPSAGGWTWGSMSYNEDKDGLTPGDLANDEYAGLFTVPAAGDWSYCVRASADGGASWSYCDAGGASCPGLGSDDGYESANAGALTSR